jgi:hypothetical protein
MSFEKQLNRGGSRQLRFAGICTLTLALLGGIYLTANEAILAEKKRGPRGPPAGQSPG